jgi:cysteine desulfurase
MVYLDNQATTRMAPEVFEAMKPYFCEIYGNSSSKTHQYGIDAEKAVGDARLKVANSIGAYPEQIFFTSGATEANNIAIHILNELGKNQTSHFLTVNTEHSSVLETIEREDANYSVIKLEVNENGQIPDGSIHDFFSSPQTKFASIMWANNEIGVIHPIRDIAEMAQQNGVLFHSDATQALGKIKIDMSRDKLDFASFSGHKIYGPKGCGFLYIRNPKQFQSLPSLIRGGNQESSIRAGTLNVPAIVGLGRACELLDNDLKIQNNHTESLRDQLFEMIEKEIEDVIMNGYYNKYDKKKNKKYRLSGNLNLYFDGVEGESLFGHFKEIAVSSGSACHSNAIEPSHVLLSLNPDRNRALSSVRVSIGRYNTIKDIEIAGNEIINAVLSSRKEIVLI